MRKLFVLVVLTTALFGACKKKAADDPAAKPVEGSAASTGSAAVATGSGTPTAEPAAVKGDVPAAPVGAKDIVETAKAAGNFTTLLKAIEAANLGATLAGAGPFTVFAPTDEAFAKLPPKELEALLADKTKLEALLQYHVTAGAVAAKDLATVKAVKSVQGGELVVDTASGVKIGGATVVTPDIAASNGVIHAIDTVLLPAAK